MLPARLNRPLDFLVVSDHAENLGLAPAIAESNPELLKSEWGKMEHDLVKQGTDGRDQGLRQLDGRDGSAQGSAQGHDGLAKTMWQKVTDGGREVQRAGPVHRLHRLRMDVEP